MLWTMAHLRAPLDIRRESDEETKKGLYLFVLTVQSRSSSLESLII